MVKLKKEPVRTCVACRETSEKKKLIRIVKTTDGIKIDPTGKLAGRGAYICDSMDCLKSAMKNDKLSRALKTNVPNGLMQELEGNIKKKNN